MKHNRMLRVQLFQEDTKTVCYILMICAFHRSVRDTRQWYMPNRYGNFRYTMNMG